MRTASQKVVDINPHEHTPLCRTAASVGRAHVRKWNITLRPSRWDWEKEQLKSQSRLAKGSRRMRGL